MLNCMSALYEYLGGVLLVRSFSDSYKSSDRALPSWGDCFARGSADFSPHAWNTWSAQVLGLEIPAKDKESIPEVKIGINPVISFDRDGYPIPPNPADLRDDAPTFKAYLRAYMVAHCSKCFIFY